MPKPIASFSLFTCLLCLLFSIGATAGQYSYDRSLDHSTSVAGEDNNNNGIRDDVQNYIDSLPDSEAQKNALKQVSQAINEAMELVVNGDASSSKLHAMSWTVSKAVAYLWSQYDEFNRW
ncbi:hypothetical protein [Shewanella sp.]|uniref:hypothetical protein n=1 Tax=Shewanella sp. TaxID=50422 RepID=UPI003A96DA9A